MCCCCPSKLCCLCFVIVLVVLAIGFVFGFGVFAHGFEKIKNSLHYEVSGTGFNARRLFRDIPAPAPF